MLKQVHNREHRGFQILLFLNTTASHAHRYEVQVSKEIDDNWFYYKQWRGRNSQKLLEAAIASINEFATVHLSN